MRVFNGIGNQIEQDLVEAQFVAVHEFVLNVHRVDKEMVQAPEIVANVSKLTGLSTKTIHDTFKERFWAKLTPAEKQRLMHLLVERVSVNDDGVDIEFKTNEIKSVKEVYSEQHA